MHHNENSLQEKKLVISPADLEVYYKVDLKDAIVVEESKEQFKELCTQKQDVFLVDSSDIGNTGFINLSLWK